MDIFDNVDIRLICPRGHDSAARILCNLHQQRRGKLQRGISVPFPGCEPV